ncbi:MAG: WbqC family protein [Oscillospiraceae bacterium]|nr:WbqC family protein [Oscillospiraceae bacterium]
MKLAIMQPYFFPYIGYWQLINAVDKFVIYDDVAYINRGWINRNNFLINGEKKMFSMELKGASQNKLINEIEIFDNFVKFQKLLKFNYSKAPYYKSINEIVIGIIKFDTSNLAAFLENSINIICSYLKIKTNIIISSAIEKNNDFKAQNKILHICKLIGASDYYNAIGGMDLYNKSEFYDSGIKLKFIKSNINMYKQFNNVFIPGLSIIDILMFNSVDSVQEMLEDYTLIQ